MARSGRTPITLTDAERTRLERIARDPRKPQKCAWRARIVLGPGTGCGLLRDKTPPSGRRPVPEDRVRALIDLAMSPPHASHWTLRALAERLGMVVSDAHDILRRHRLQPHRVRMFKVSWNPKFEQKIHDDVGLHVNPSGNEVSVIQDNVSYHKSAEVHEWLGDRPDWTFQFTPAPVSRTNAVEGFFARLNRGRLGNAVFNSVEDCTAAIEALIEHHNAHRARPFRWGRRAEDLIASWKRGHHKIESRH